MTKPPALRRQPRGILSEKPVFFRLMPEERIQLKRLSEYSGESMSSVVRGIYLIGVGPYTEKLRRTQRNSTQNCVQAVAR